jgi:TonB family protein
MKRIWLCFALALCAFVSCGRKPSVIRTTESSPTPAVQPTANPVEATASLESSKTPAGDFAKLVESIRPAVVIVSVFDETGHLSANGHGFFVSGNGKFVADRSVMAGGVNAVAKAADGAIYNVSGLLGQTSVQNLVLLQAETNRTLPFLTASSKALPDVGAIVGVVLSPVERATSTVLEEKITARFSDEAGEWLDITPALPRTSTGAPVINQRGEVVGIVGFRAGNNSCSIRPATNASALLTHVSSSTIANWQVLSLAHPTPPTTARTATPTKIPLRGSKLTYAPAPRYPVEVKHSQWTIKGSGNFRVLFDANGHTVTVQTVRSTGNPLLDQAAVSALHDWRSEPGREWSLVVPITFRP